MGCKYLTTGAKGKARSITSLAGDAPVAGRAKHRSKLGRSTKAEMRLILRIKDFENLSSKEAGVSKRRASGGFHRPGSLQ